MPTASLLDRLEFYLNTRQPVLTGHANSILLRRCVYEVPLFIESGDANKVGGTRYFCYRDKYLSRIPTSLLSLVADYRYSLSSESSFWHCTLATMKADRNQLSLRFINAAQTKSYEISYFGVRRLATEVIDVSRGLEMIVQELTYNSSGGFRHIMADLFGRHVSVDCDDMTFREAELSGYSFEL